jgi:trigger factor
VEVASDGQESPLKVDYIEETSVRKALAFEIEPEVVDGEIALRAKDYAKKAKIPGFRPGKIPSEVIKKRFLPQILEDAAEAIVNRVVWEELEGRGLRPLANPKVTELKIDANQPMTFRAVFETLPLVQLPEYKGLEAKVKGPHVSDDKLVEELDRLRDEAARYDPVEGRAAADRDFVVLDVTYRTGGGESKQDENVLVEIGSADNHEDLNAALVGMNPGETKDVQLVYPADHTSAKLAGQTVDYTVTVKAVKTKVVPALDDEFAKDLGEFDSLDALRQRIRRQLEAQEDRRVDRDVKEALVQALVDKATFEVPDTLVERHMNARTEGLARELAMGGVDPSQANIDWKQFRESQREGAVKAAKADILLDEIARREKVDAQPAEVDAEIARYAERLSRPVEQVRAQMEKEGGLTGLRARIREDKTLDLLKADARLDFE